MKIPISEIFQSIQWEWRNTWKPSIFIRFRWCNLKCTWCDSKYSWQPEVEKATIIELDEVIEIIKSFNTKHIIFTWWEPTLFQKEMEAIIKELDYNYTFELETNWSKELSLYLEISIEQVNISPKLKNSWNNAYKIHIPKNNKVDLKFVAWNLQDLVEIKEIIDDIKDNNVIDWIYIMPLWTDKKSQVNKAVLDFCIKNWYNYCMRSHIILFGDKKGV